MGSSLVGMRSLRVSPRRSVASGFYCSVNRAGKNTVHATHVERTKKLGRFNQKRLCRKACGSPVPASPHRIQQRDVRREERPGSGWRVFFSAAAESNLKILCFFFFFLHFCSMRSFFFFFSSQRKNNNNWCHLDRQTDGVRCTGTKTETVIHDVLYPRSPQWNQVVVTVEITITNWNWLSLAGTDIFIILLR